jgi:hypothetical protein
MTMEWPGQFLEDFEVGAIYRSRLGRTLSETATDTDWSVG